MALAVPLPHRAKHGFLLLRVLVSACGLDVLEIAELRPMAHNLAFTPGLYPTGRGILNVGSGDDMAAIELTMHAPNALETMLSTSQTARVLGLSRERVTQLARMGRLPCYRTALGRLFARDAVTALARERARRVSRANEVQP